MIGKRMAIVVAAVWAHAVLDFACAFQKNSLSRNHIIRSLTPLYLARVASFVIETEIMNSDQVEDRIEQLCLLFEQLKPYLAGKWRQAS